MSTVLFLQVLFLKLPHNKNQLIADISPSKMIGTDKCDIGYFVVGEECNIKIRIDKSTL